MPPALHLDLLTTTAAERTFDVLKGWAKRGAVRIRRNICGDGRWSRGTVITVPYGREGADSLAPGPNKRPSITTQAGPDVFNSTFDK